MFFLVVFREIQCLHNFNHDSVCHVTELNLSTKFHAMVSVIHGLNQNKKKKEKNNFENGFTTFPRHITDPFFLSELPSYHIYINLLEV